MERLRGHLLSNLLAKGRVLLDQAAVDMKRFAILWSVVVMALTAGVAAAQDGAKDWMRYPAISPDGKSIAFSYRGDLWLVPSSGGEARLLTSHEAYEANPVWSPDGKQIAFASDRHGNFDVFLMPAAGGNAKRLTFHSAGDVPSCFTPDGKRVVFSSRRQDAPQASIGHGSMSELYSVSVDADRPRQILTTPAEDAVYNRDGSQLVYHDYKGFEDALRKHHVSAVTRDLWMYEPATGKHTKLSTFGGEDRTPVFAPGGKSIYYLSEQGGNYNVWEMQLGDKPEPKQVTKHGPHPVRFLTIANDGTLAYGYNGEIWIRKPGEESSRVNVKAVIDNRANTSNVSTLRSGATEFSVAPHGEEIAFVIRGEIFVVSVEHGTTKRVTDTPGQERSVGWAPDGRTLYYAGERDHSWNLYKTSITREDEDRFATSTLLTEEPVLVSDDETFQPLVSPDGKSLAYLHNRDEIRMLDLATKQSSTLVPAQQNYSYQDGDIEYDWSPDSKWLAFTYNAHQRWLGDVGMVNLGSGEITNVTNSGYSEASPWWSADGKTLLFFSDRLGLRSHGSWGSDVDIFGFYLTQDAFDWINLSEEDLEIRKKKEAEKKKKEAAAASDEEGDDEEDKDEDKVEPIKVELDDIEYRIKRLTLNSAPMGGYDISPDGEKVVYFAQVEGDWDLWMSEIRTGSTTKLVAFESPAPGGVEFNKDGDSVFVSYGNGSLAKVAVGDGPSRPEPISYGAEMTINGPEERAYILEHAWRQVKRKFYREDLHGVDWSGLRQNYAAFLPTITNNYDFADMLSELLGELNASHTGARYRPRGVDGDRTAALGLLYDTTFDGLGLKVAEVITRGPLDRAETKIKAGAIITHIDGVRLTPDVNPWALLNRKVDTFVRLGLTNPESGDDWEEVVKPISTGEETQLLYHRWVQQRREYVEKVSGGRVGYVHIEGMDDESFRTVYQDTLGRNSDKEALVVDTRFNGGGWLHDDLVTFLGGKDYISIKPRGKELGDFGTEPAFRWSRPVAVVQSESNYSDAHMFPYAFKQLKLGKLVGAPVPGTGTAVWWETQIDPSLVFGIPQVGMVSPDGNYLENTQLEPDVLVLNTPEGLAAGEDPQLKAAVDVLLEQLGEKKAEKKQ